MRLIVCKDYKEMSEKAAELVAAQITLKPDCVLGLATGSTPVGMYDKLVRMNKEGRVDFSNVTSFNLDEYYPIRRGDPNSYYSFMRENLFSKINIDPEKTHIPNGETDDPERECMDYEKLIQKHGGIDLQILGIGRNGHIGFNEPDAVLSSYTHLVKLTQSTIDANSRFFASCEEVPKYALTMGISTILSAKKIIIMASGVSKSRVVSELLGDGINMSVPAALLKTHPDVVFLCDRDAYYGARMGVDIGGTNIKFAIVEGGKITYKNTIKTAKTSEDITNDISKEINKLKGNYDIKAVGIGIPGIIRNGNVKSANLPFDDTPVGKLISEKTGFDVTVDNDANCAALGEVKFGSTKDCDNIVLVTLGTGIGGGIIIRKQIYSGNGCGGEIGHIVIQADNGQKCNCGEYGCWESYASVSGLVRYAKEKAEENKNSILYELYSNSNSSMSGELVFEAMNKGCTVAREVFERYIHYLSVGIRSVINIFAPDAVVLAGGITHQGEALLKPLKETLPKDVRIEISTLQSDAGALGAAML